MTGKKGRDFLRMFLSGAAEDMPDKQHRVTIPPMLREYAGLDRELTVIGAGNRAEIWDTASWNAYYASTEAAGALTSIWLFFSSAAIWESDSSGSSASCNR